MTSILQAPSNRAAFPQKPNITRGHSCVLCRRRKIKCDGARPCRNCQRSQAECVAAEIPPAKRRKRKQEDLAARLRLAEETLSKAGLKIEDDNDEYGEGGEHSTENTAEKPYVEGGSKLGDGKLIVERGQSRLIENSIWGNLSAEVIEDSVHLLQHSEDEIVDDIRPVSDHCSLLFGRLIFSNSLMSIHPPPVQMFQLWQVFLNSVHPMTKLVHAPSVQELLLHAMTELDKVSANTTALMMSIYHSAVVSLDDQACQNILGESRAVALTKYSTATQQALVNAKLLRTSSIMVLQALTLYLLSTRTSTDYDTVWVLSGVAIKIGQRMGLHRESTSASLSVLEAEMRRRLWWQIFILEGRSSFLSGVAASPILLFQWPSHMLNVNDSDLSPSMREPPVEQAAITEMLFVSISYEIGLFMHKVVFDGQKSTSPISDLTEQLSSKLKAIDDFEASLEQRFIRYCDPSVPLHYLAQMVIRHSMSKNRLRLYTAPRSASAQPQSQAEKNAAFSISLKILDIAIEGHSSTGQVKLKGYMWHVRAFFQLEAFIFTLSQLRVRMTGVEVDWAWELVEAIYLHHEEILRGTKNKLWFAVGNLCLKAWEQRVKGLGSQHVTEPLMSPAFVRELYAQRGIKDPLVSARGSQEMTNKDYTNEIQVPLMWDGQTPKTPWSDLSMPSTYMQFNNADMEGMDWEHWQTLFDDCGVPTFT